MEAADVTERTTALAGAALVAAWVVLAGYEQPMGPAAFSRAGR